MHIHFCLSSRIRFEFKGLDGGFGKPLGHHQRGVAGLHRLLDQLPRLETARVLIACAGMEGALPTVLAGLVPQPVIGVPVSVGYGVSQGGRAALDGMLASCAPGLCVVNIDNGYGAAMAALRMLRSG